LCIDKDITYRFLEDVIREIAALTPEAYFHMGGDEAHSTPHADYIRFVERVQPIVQAAGKQIVGWEEIANARLLPGSVVQAWRSDLAAEGARQGAKVIFSPASKTYLDMQYDEHTPLGLHWAGYVEVRASYEWDPATQIKGVAESDILGVEAPLWAETLRTSADIERMVFPRLPGIAEIGWSPAGRSWDAYRLRLAAHGPRFEALGINFYRSPQVPW
jgi:hexosaminidase